MKWNECYKVHRILHSLRESVGDSDFGFRIQGLLGHTLIRLGIKILEINHQGHPDIVGKAENKLIKLEVEAAVKARNRIIEKEDLHAIKSADKNEKGYFAVLDCGLPTQWLLIDYERLKWRMCESLSMIILKSLSDKKFSITCTEEFFHVILSNAEQLPSFTFSFLRGKALRGEGL